MSAAEISSSRFVSSKSSLPTLAQNEAMVELTLQEQRDDERSGDRDRARSNSLRRMVNAQAPAPKLQAANTSAPTQTDLNVDKTDPTPTPDSSGKLFAFLTELMLFQIQTAKDHSNIDQLNQKMSQAAVVQSQAALQKSLADLQDLQASLAQQSWLSSLLTLVTVCLTMVTVATGGVASMILAGVTLAMQTIQVKDGQTTNDMLGQWLSKMSTGDAIGVEVGIAFLTTLLMVAGDKAAGSKTASSIAGGTVATANSIGEAGIEMTEMGANAASKALSGAAGIAGSVDAAATQTIDSVVEESVELTARQQITRLFQQLQAGKFMMALGTGQFGSTIAQAATADIDPSAMIDLGNGKKIPVKDIVTIVIQIATTASLLAAGGTIDADGSNSSIMKKLLASKLSPEALEDLTQAARSFEKYLRMFGATFSAQLAVTETDQSAILKDQGETQKMQTVAQGMISSLEATFAATDAAIKGLYQNYADMNQDAEEFLKPYDPQNWYR